MRKSFLQPILIIGVLFLVACGPATNPTPAVTLPPIQSPTATSLPASTVSPSGATLTTVQVSIEGFAFTPEELTVPVGTTVTWTNLDSVQHTITADDGSWGSGQLGKNAKYSFTFTQAGTYAYHCTNHPSMTATLVVTP
jgi:plastocyanin